MLSFLIKGIPLVGLFLITAWHSASAQISVSLPDVNATMGSSGVIPVSVGDLSGQSVVAFVFTLTYDPAVLEITGVSGVGTLTEGNLLLENTSTPGEISVTNATETAYEGSGTLLNLEVNYLAGGTSALTFSSFIFNEGNPAAQTSGGSVEVGGDITPPDTLSISVPVQLLGTVNESLTVPVEVGEVTGLSVNSYAFTFDYDPAAVRVEGVDVQNTLTSSGTPTTSSPSAGRFTVSWSNAGALMGSGVLVKLVITPLLGQTSEFGLSDVVFNEGNPIAKTTGGGVLTATEASGEAVSVVVSEISGSVDQEVSIPVTVGDLTGKLVTSFEMTLDYDPEIVQLSGVSLGNSLIDGVNPTVNLSNPGLLIVSWASVTPIEGAGTLMSIDATLLKAGVSSLLFDSFRFNEGSPEAVLTSGSVSVTGSGNGGGGNEDQTNVSLPTGLSGNRGAQVLIPVTTEDISSENITSFNFTVTFDDRIVNVGALELGGTLSEGLQVDLNTNTPGQVIVSYSGATAINGEGVLLHLVANLERPGNSSLSFSAFRYNEGNPSVVTTNGSLQVEGVGTYLQLVHNSSDAPAVDVYINDEKRLESLTYGQASGFLDIENTLLKIDIVNDFDADNSSPITSSTVTLENGNDYAAILNGLFSGSGNQAIGLVVQESQQQASNANTVGLVMFQGSPDAPLLNAYIVGEAPAYNRLLTLAKGLGFGESFVTAEFDPGEYNIEITQNNGPRVGIYRADLSRTGGASLLFMINGFVNPLINQPGLTMNVYAPDGQGIALPVAVSNEGEGGLSRGFDLFGNYPNPFNPSTTIHFTLPEPAIVHVEVFDLMGRSVLSVPGRSFYGGETQSLQLDASPLASGTYIYRVIAEGTQGSYIGSRKMTLLK